MGVLAMGSTLWPFADFDNDCFDSSFARTGGEFFRDLYDSIFEDAARDAEVYYFDAEAGSDENTGRSPDQAFKSLWWLRIFLWDTTLTRKVVCRLRRGCRWTYADEALALEEWRGRRWFLHQPVSVVQAFWDSMDDFQTRQYMLSCRPGRESVTLEAFSEGTQGIRARPCIWGWDPDAGATYTATDGRAVTPVTQGVGLYLAEGHRGINVSSLRFGGFLTGIDVRAGSGDVFYGLSFGSTISKFGINVTLLPSSLKKADNGVIYAYPVSSGYSSRVLIGFCEFIGVGAEGPDGEPHVNAETQAGYENAASWATQAVRIGECATLVCVDHCLFDGCQDCIAGVECSTGHLICCNTFRNARYDGRFYWEDGNGIDLIAHRPRTADAFSRQDLQGDPRPTAIFDNLFDGCQGLSVVMHMGCSNVEIFNNLFVNPALNRAVLAPIRT